MLNYIVICPKFFSICYQESRLCLLRSYTATVVYFIVAGWLRILEQPHNQPPLHRRSRVSLKEFYCPCVHYSCWHEQSDNFSAPASLTFSSVPAVSFVRYNSLTQQYLGPLSEGFHNQSHTLKDRMLENLSADPRVVGCRRRVVGEGIHQILEQSPYTAQLQL